MPTETSLNLKLAAVLSEIADLLEQQRANPYRITAYRRAAQTLRHLNMDIKKFALSGGVDALKTLPGIGEGISRTINEVITTGRCTLLDSMRGSIDPERLFQTVPGIGPTTAHKIHETLHISSLAALEQAAHNGRLNQVGGLGERKIAAIRASLSAMLGRRRTMTDNQLLEEPAVDILLAVDKIYRAKALSGQLPTIAPKRFNPGAKSWLPVMHLQKQGWHFTVLFSNTALAHKLNKVHDWVVIYYYDQTHRENQCTAVTENRGSLSGKRVIRGRERECKTYYENMPAAQEHQIV